MNVPKNTPKMPAGMPAAAPEPEAKKEAAPEKKQFEVLRGPLPATPTAPCLWNSERVEGGWVFTYGPSSASFVGTMADMNRIIREGHKS